MDENMFFESATKLADRFRQREVSPVEFTKALIERIRRSSLNAYCEVAEVEALKAAEQAERKLSSRGYDVRRQPLLGVPVSVKDNIETAGIRTSYGSKVFAGNVPGSDAVCVSRLKAAGAVVIGKTTLSEFGTKAVVDSPLSGVTCNPWDLTRVVGGSSGGAAAAVAAGLGPIGLGNDQSGSIRIPAALCGVSGIKPTSGRIPFVPNLSPWSQLFQVGIIARTVDDLELSLGVLEGPHPADPLSAPVFDAASPFGEGGHRPRIAWSSTIGFARIDSEVLDLVRSTIACFGNVADVDSLEIDLSPALIARKNLVRFKRAIEIGQHLDEWSGLMDPEVVEYVKLGEEVGLADVRTGLDSRTKVYNEVERVLAVYDFIATPTLSVAAFEIGLAGPDEIAGTSSGTLNDWFPYTYPFSLSGHPAITVPAGFTHEGLPVGVQLVGRRFSDRALLTLARVLEEVQPWLSIRPPFS